MKAAPGGPIVIIGAGPAGLGAALHLHRAGCRDWTVLERETVPGGLARSVTDPHGFAWDLGGHVVFSHYGLFSRLLDEWLGPEEWLWHERESWVRVRGRWVPYPFQNNIHRLGPEDCAACLAGLIRAAIERPGRPPANFDEFITGTFGEGIAALFMRPYNEKVWGYPPARLAPDWVADRVSVPDVVRVARQVVLKGDDVAWGPNNRFRFPRSGGTGAIWSAAAAGLPPDRVRLGCQVVSLDSHARRLRLAGGEEVPYGSLISTMPLDRLAAVSGRRDWADLAAGLLHSSVHVVGLALSGAPTPSVGSKCWMYFPEEAVSFYRVTQFSRYSPRNVPNPGTQWSLLAEVSESPERSVDAAGVVDSVIGGLAADGLIEGRRQVLHTWHQRIEYAYPTPALGRDAILERLQPALYEAGILSRGRFGAWRYEVGNMDHSFMQGAEAAAHLLRGIPELTVWHPDVANAPHPVLGSGLPPQGPARRGV